jgi:energy-coupling factor transport system ATP-binding protein
MTDDRTENYYLRAVSFTYPGQTEPALRQIDLRVTQGEFIVVCGASGSGKSTLLRLLKPELTPHGKREGELRLFGEDADGFSPADSARNVGFLMQDPEYQTVTHDVLAELAFGPENLGMDSAAIGLRIAEVAAYFGLESILEKKTGELSGGQKQLLSLASVLTMHPRVLILDEPTSQLDPTAADALLHTVTRLCRENGITVIISEHRLEQLLPAATRVLIMEKGRILADCPPREIDRSLFFDHPFVYRAMPTPLRLHAALGVSGPAPLQVAEGRRMLAELLAGRELKTELPPVPVPSAEPAVACKNLWFAYDKSAYVLRGLDLTVPKGSFFALMGANAAGKSTVLSILGGVLEPGSGTVRLLGKNIRKYKQKDLYRGTVALLPQKCEALFAAATIREDLLTALADSGLKKEEKTERMLSVARFLELEPLLDRHPYDVSGGEMQRAALAIVLLRDPQIILLDEPTKGIDNVMKQALAEKLLALCAAGKTVVMVSHDTEFCAEYCTGCAMLFRGRTTAAGDKRAFFAQHYFYTTAANKTARAFFPGAVTEEEVIRLCKENLPGSGLSP